MNDILNNITENIYAECNSSGWWDGCLSASALSTAVAVFALAQTDRHRNSASIERGLAWLARNVNPDGGWGDTADSPSNLSTTALCWAALSVAPPDNPEFGRLTESTTRWLSNNAGSIEPAPLANAITASYGADRTFSAPILTMCALAGRLGSGQAAWQLVAQLPFELALLPRALLGALRLNVVSYALPALITIGILRHTMLPAAPGPARLIRSTGRKKALDLLEKLQPANGGFLEATPLTGFVVMSLAGAGEKKHPVARKGTDFLLKSMRTDGSWPIDTNLSTWVTTLAVNALNPDGYTEIRNAPAIRDRLLSQQTATRNMFTNAAPGGWAWTNLPGGVPDADDTAGALLALRRLGTVDHNVKETASRGIRWLLNLQNRDGGIPTFCRGWGKLPFDRSCPEITAHAMLALDEWYNDVHPDLQTETNRFMTAAARYLDAVQRDDGAWLPLWFGNQQTKSRHNPVYGTARVLLGILKLRQTKTPQTALLAIKGADWLASVQNKNGSWGGDANIKPSIEETAIATAALTSTPHQAAADRGRQWLAEHTNNGTAFPAAPIGLYFASLWYSEKMYPLLFTLPAFHRKQEPDRKCNSPAS